MSQEVPYQSVPWHIFEKLPQQLGWRRVQNSQTECNGRVANNFFLSREQEDASGNVVYLHAEVWTSGEQTNRRGFAVFHQTLTTPGRHVSSVSITMDHSNDGKIPPGSLRVAIDVDGPYEEGKAIPENRRLVFRFDETGRLRRAQVRSGILMEENEVICIDSSMQVKEVLEAMGVEEYETVELVIAETLASLMQGVTQQEDNSIPDLLNLIRARRRQTLPDQRVISQGLTNLSDPRISPPQREGWNIINN